MWQHVKLSEQICPWDTLACCWDVKQPTNKQTWRAFGLLVENRVLATALRCTWFCATFLTVPHVVPAVFISSKSSLVTWLLLLWWLQCRAWHVTFSACFLRVCPVYLHFLLVISCVMESCLACAHRSLNVSILCPDETARLISNFCLKVTVHNTVSTDPFMGHSAHCLDLA